MTTAATEKKTRVYAVRNTDMLDAHPPRLVEAKTAAEALSYIYKPYTAEALSALDYHAVITKYPDIKIEQAGA